MSFCYLLFVKAVSLRPDVSCCSVRAQESNGIGYFHIKVRAPYVLGEIILDDSYRALVVLSDIGQVPRLTTRYISLEVYPVNNAYGGVIEIGQ